MRSVEGTRRTHGEIKKKEKKHHEHFISPPVTTVHGRPNEGCNSCATVVQVLHDLFYVFRPPVTVVREDL